jgi:hypothetical protein
MLRISSHTTAIHASIRMLEHARGTIAPVRLAPMCSLLSIPSLVSPPGKKYATPIYWLWERWQLVQYKTMHGSVRRGLADVSLLHTDSVSLFICPTVYHNGHDEHNKVDDNKVDDNKVDDNKVDGWMDGSL